MAKLTDTQLVLLAKAAQREDGAAVLPERMNKAAAMKVGSSLVGRKLLREIRTKPQMPIWREDADRRSLSLVITRAGRDAIGVEQDADEAASSAAAQESKPDRRNPKKQINAETRERPTPHAAPRSGSKQALVIDLLSTKQGTTLDALVEATGWLPHTVRAALTGLRKRGFAVERQRDEKTDSIYRIAKQSKAGAA